MVLRDTANTGGFLLGLLRLVEGISLRSVSQHYSALLEVVSGQFRPAPTEWASTAERAWRADLSRSM
jgi:hypothetical protein